MTSHSYKTFGIVGGPSKFDLMVSLFDGNRKSRRTVDFQLESIKEFVHISIFMVEQEDGSGESWNFEGVTWNGEMNYKVKGYFNTKNRAGTMNFVVPQLTVWNPDFHRHEVLRDEAEEIKFSNFISNLRRKS